MNKKNILAFILGFLASGIVAYAALSASDIDYKDGKKVDQALNELYEKSNVTFNETFTNYKIATVTETDSIDLDLKNGRYICNLTYSLAANAQELRPVVYNETQKISITGYDNIQNISKKVYAKTGDVKAGTTYNYNETYVQIFEITMNSDKKINASIPNGWSNTNAPSMFAITCTNIG